MDRYINYVPEVEEQEEIEGFVGRVMIGKTIKSVIDPDHYDRTNLRIEFTDGTELSFTACGCCNGIAIYGKKDEETIRILKERRDEEIRKNAELDADARKRGLI